MADTVADNVTEVDFTGDAGEQIEMLRLLEAVLFAAVEPLDLKTLAARLPDDADIPKLLAELQAAYAGRGIHLSNIGGKWAFRTAPDLADRLQIERVEQRRLSRAALETLAIIAYHQPVTRAEIEEIRGVAVNKGTIDMLLEVGWIRPGRRRQTPGRPMTWVTSEDFLSHFGLEGLGDLPGVKELKAAGLLDSRPSGNVYGTRGEMDELPFSSIEDAADAAEDENEPLEAEDSDPEGGAA